MRSHIPRLRTSLLTLSLSALVLPPAYALPPGGAKTQPSGAKVSLDKKSIRSGGKIVVTGTNWKSKGSRVQDGAKVTVKIDDGVIIAVFPIKNKRFRGTVVIPSQIKPGRHWLRFLAAEPATSIRSDFRVVNR